MTRLATQVRNLISQSKHSIDYDDTPIGVGQQGAVYPVLAIDNVNRTDFLLKLYRHDSPARTVVVQRNIVEMVRHLEEHRDQAQVWTDGLEALPRNAVQQLDGDGLIGVLMHRIHGKELDSLESIRCLGEGGLGLRLELARQIVNASGRLHAIGVVPADITAPNVLVDTHARPARAYLVDIDGGGVRDRGKDYRTHPLVLGQTYETWMPPEIHIQQKAEPDEISDRWTLAMVVHCCLFVHQLPNLKWINILPFWWGVDYSEICGPNIRWPPGDAVSTAKPQPFAVYKSILTDVGNEIRGRFRQAFDVGSRITYPSRRPTAKDWETVLARAKRWLYSCPSGHEFVCWDRASCPQCGAPVKHAQLFDNHGQHEVRRDYVVNAAAVGLPQSVGACARIERRGQELVIESQAPLSVSGVPLGPGERLALASGVRHVVEVRPSDLQGRSSFQVQVPS